MIYDQFGMIFLFTSRILGDMVREYQYRFVDLDFQATKLEVQTDDDSRFARFFLQVVSVLRYRLVQMLRRGGTAILANS